jgi:DNA phosphorothioation-dependent restriction protein DptG
MNKNNMWGKIRKSVAEGVAVAAEKTEEYTRLGKAKLDILVIRRRISHKRTELGGTVYTAVKEGTAEGIFTTDHVKSLVGELDGLEAELAETKKRYEELKRKAGSDVKEVSERAKSGMKDLTAKAKSKVKDIKKKTRAKKAGTESAVEEGEKKE